MSRSEFPRLALASDGEQARIDIETLAATLRYIHGDLEGEARLERVRLALAMALVEIDRAEERRRALRPAFFTASRFVPASPKR